MGSLQSLLWLKKGLGWSKAQHVLPPGSPLSMSSCFLTLPSTLGYFCTSNSMNINPSGFQGDLASPTCITPVSCRSHKSPEQETKHKLEDGVGSRKDTGFL